MNQKFFSMIDQYKHHELRIVVSPQEISAWANITGPDGEINTVRA